VPNQYLLNYSGPRRKTNYKFVMMRSCLWMLRLITVDLGAAWGACRGSQVVARRAGRACNSDRCRHAQNTTLLLSYGRSSFSCGYCRSIVPGHLVCSFFCPWLRPECMRCAWAARFAKTLFSMSLRGLTELSQSFLYQRGAHVAAVI